MGLTGTRRRVFNGLATRQKGRGKDWGNFADDQDEAPGRSRVAVKRMERGYVLCQAMAAGADAAAKARVAPLAVAGARPEAPEGDRITTRAVAPAGDDVAAPAVEEAAVRVAAPAGDVPVELAAAPVARAAA